MKALKALVVPQNLVPAYESITGIVRAELARHGNVRAALDAAEDCVNDVMYDDDHDTQQDMTALVISLACQLVIGAQLANPKKAVAA